MENFFTPDKIVGRASKEEKESLVKKKKYIFQNQQFEDLKNIEAKKSPEILEAINLANSVTNELRNKYGLGKMDIPPENIHLIKNTASASIKSPLSYGEGTTDFDRLRILTAERNNLQILTQILIHEILHMKTLHSFDINDKEQGKYKGGLVIKSRNQGFRGAKYFSVLDEAMTEAITKRIIQKEMNGNHPIFMGLEESTKKTFEKYPEEVNFSGSLIFSDHLFYAEENKNGVFDRVMDKLAGVKSSPVWACHFAYQREQDILNSIIDKLFDRNKDKFNSREDVYLLFEKSYLTGNMVKLGLLIERTFGSGTFRRLGQLDFGIIENQDKDQKQQNFLNNL